MQAYRQTLTHWSERRAAGFIRRRRVLRLHCRQVSHVVANLFLDMRLALWMGTRKGTSAPAVNCSLARMDEAEGQNDKND
jgi:hypothetical protein